MAKSKKPTGKKAIKKTATSSGFSRGEKKQMEQDILKDLLKLSAEKPVKPATKKAVRKTPSSDLESQIYRDFLKLSKEPVKPRRITPEPPRRVEPPKVRREPVRPEKPVKQPKKIKPEPPRVKRAKAKKEPARKGYKFDSSKPLADINLDKARKKTIRETKKSIYSKRSQLKKKLDSAKNERERQNTLNEIYRTSRWLEKANERLGKKGKKKGFERKTVRKGPKEVQRNIYLWEAGKSIDDLIDSGLFNTFIVNGRRMKAHEVMEIMEEFDDLEELGALHNDYYVEINQNSNTKTVTINLPNIESDGEK